MPVIRITDETWERLKKWAIPLEDTPEDALKKVLEAAEKNRENKNIASPIIKEMPEVFEEKIKLIRGQKTTNQIYYHFILEALHELGGKARVEDVLGAVGEKMKAILTKVDFQKIPSGSDTRWHNTAQWARFTLVKKGLLKSDSPRGIWEISAKGEEELIN